MDILTARREAARALVETLQLRHVHRLEGTSAALGHPCTFEPVSWLRDGGRHGGGTRLQLGDTPVFDRASVNVSVVHYDDRPDKALGSATALSAIVHPRNPWAPSMHLHLSWTSYKDGRGYWRVMADLNPAIELPGQTERFLAILRKQAGEHFAEGAAQGDRYFRIPPLERTRGVAHFYLEAFDSGDFPNDLSLAKKIEDGVIDTYARLVQEAVEAHPEPSEADRAAQLRYHTLYLFQVLTLDRGTTSGLLVHDQNDVGIMGSLPSRVDRALLASWRERVPALQQPLVDALVAALPAQSPAPVTLDAKQRLAQAVRAHYRAHPEALALQARGSVVPPTVANHGGPASSG